MTQIEISPHARDASRARTLERNTVMSIDLAALASQAKEAKALPKVTRKGEAKENPLMPALLTSHDKGVAITLPVVPESEVKRITLNLRYAARDASLGVSIRKEVTSKGVVISFQARQRRNA